MALKVDKAQLEIEILQDTAMQNLKSLEKQIRDAKTEMKKFKEGTDEYNQAAQKVKQLNNTYEELSSKIKITDMPMSMLIKRQRELNAALREMRPSSASYQQYRDELDATNKRIMELKGKAVDTGFSLTKVADNLNKYAVMASGVIAGFTGIAMTAKKCVDSYAQMDESMSDVMKYTNMTKAQVIDLNESLKKMDTRTSREQLNALAGDAGRLGITSKKDILDFVDAADKINVALGDELGQDAVKTIGRLAMMFGEDKTKGLRGAMLATGSAVNQLAQSVGSDANYLVDFLSRVSGVAKLAKVSQADIMGFASVLNLSNQQVEMAATAFQTLMLKMYQNPAKFAKLAGKDVKEFTNLLKTNANEAIIQFMTSLKGQGGFDKIAPLFKDMGLDGVRASGVLSTLAGKIADVRKQQLISNQAYKDGTSAISEFNIKNHTVQAGFDKAKKDIQNMAIELGEKLLPVMTDMIHTTSATIKVLSTIVTFMIKHSAAIGTVTVALVAYVTATKLSMVWEKLHITSLKDLKIAVQLLGLKFKELWITMLDNPFGIIAAALAALSFGLYKYAKSVKGVQKGMADMNEQIKEEKKHYDNINSAVAKYLPIAQDAKRSIDDRKRAIDILRKVMPNYFKDLDTESAKLYNVADAAKAATTARRVQVRFEYFEAQRDYITKKTAFEKEKKTESAGSTGSFTTNYGSSSIYLGTLEEDMKEAQGRAMELSKEVLNIDKEMKQESANTRKNKPKTNTQTGNGTGLPTKKKKTKKTNPETPYRIDTQNIEAEHQKELNEIKKNDLEKNKTEEEYNLDSLDADTKFYKNKLALIERYLQKAKTSKMKADLKKDEQDTMSKLLDIDKNMGEARIKVAEEQRDKNLDDLDKAALESKQKLAKQYSDGEISEGEYNVKIDAIDENVKSGRLAVLKDYYDIVNSLDIKGGQTKLKAVEEANKAVLQADIENSTARAKTKQTMEEELNNFKKNSGIKSTPDEDNDERLKALKKSYEEAKAFMKAHNMDTTQLEAAFKQAEEQSETEHQKAILDIKDQYGIDTTKERYKIELQALNEKHTKELMSEKEYNQAKKNLDKKYNESKKLDFATTMNFIQGLASNVSSAMQGFADAETIASDAKYDKQITAAKKAGKDTTKLEEQKEAAQNQIKKKYADIQFAAAVLQIGSTTAVTAMEAYKALAGIPIVGPVLGAAAAAAAVAAGAAQIKVAKANRDAAKGLYTGGYSDDYIEGYTNSGNSHDVAGMIPVHKNEWVANHEAVANPHVRRFLDVFNVAQRNGTINMLDTTAILQKLQLTGGRYSGGYTDTPTGNVTTQNIAFNSDNSTLLKELQQQNKYLKTIADKKLTLAMTDVRDKLNELQIYESNASR